MKKSVKALLLVLCAVVLVVATVFGTIAYMTSQDQVVNTFTFGNVSITMDETDVDQFGVKDSENRVKANEYKLIAGKSYLKDPTIHVEGTSEKSYLFVRIDNGISSVAELTGMTNFKPVAAQDGLYVYAVGEAEYTQTQGLVAEDIPVFTGFTVGNEVTGSQLEAAAANKITVTAFAIQADLVDIDTAKAEAIKVLFPENA